MDNNASKAIEEDDDIDKEKEAFEVKIGQLRRELEESDRIYQQRKEEREQAKSRYESEVESAKACVAHLKRVLKSETERRMKLQEKSQTLTDKKELVDRRTSAKILESEKIREAARSQFLQEKSELENKLSMLKERRLMRDKQLVELGEKDKALEQKLTASYEKSREVDMKQTARLFENRKEFVEKCRRLKEEWQEAFEVRMPAQAKKQLEENVRLRETCEKATEKLLQVQNENRNLKMSEKSLELEKEIQSSVEDHVIKKKYKQEQHLHQILKAQQDLQSHFVQTSPEKFPKKESDGPDSSAISWFLDSNNKQSEAYNPKYAEKQRQAVKEFLEQYESWQGGSHSEYTEKLKTKQYQLLDNVDEVAAILEDQRKYKSFLKKELNKEIEDNCNLESAILRVNRLLQTRCGKLSNERKNVLDPDLLQQLQLLFNMVSSDT